MSITTLKTQLEFHNIVVLFLIKYILIFTNNNINISIKVWILELYITDHMQKCININTPKQIKLLNTKYKLDHNKIIKSSLFKDIQEINWDSIYKCKDVSECYNI